MRQLSLRCEYLTSHYYSKLIIMCSNMNVGEHLNSGKYLLPLLCYIKCAFFVRIYDLSYIKYTKHSYDNATYFFLAVV